MNAADHGWKSSCCLGSRGPYHWGGGPVWNRDLPLLRSGGERLRGPRRGEHECCVFAQPVQRVIQRCPVQGRGKVHQRPLFDSHGHLLQRCCQTGKGSGGCSHHHRVTHQGSVMTGALTVRASDRISEAPSAISRSARRAPSSAAADSSAATPDPFPSIAFSPPSDTTRPCRRIALAEPPSSTSA